MVVVGGRSRLHLVDLGSCSRSRDGGALSLTSLGAVVTSLLSGQRQVPYRSADHKNKPHHFMPWPPDSVGQGIVSAPSVCCVRPFVRPTDFVTTISHERLQQSG